MICASVKPTILPIAVCAARQYSQSLTWLTTRFTTSRALPMIELLAFCRAR